MLISYVRGRARLVLVAGGVLTFNNWILSFFLNRRLLVNGGSVSEFSAITQPHNWIFRALDVAAGILLILIAYILSRPVRKPEKSWKVLVASTAILGIANIADALIPLPCSGIIERACQSLVHLSLSNLSLPSHVYSSTVIGICYLILPIAGFVYARYQKIKHLQLISLSTVAITLAFFGFLLNSSLHGYYNGSAATGFTQELQMLALSVWLVFIV